MTSPVCALIGDVVGSRDAADRRDLHRGIVAALDRVNADVAADLPLYPSVGDEIQGLYPRLGAALEATHRFRLALPPQVDVRFGLGVGASVVVDEARSILDGSAWWAARTAIQAVESAAGRSSHAALRTGVAGEPPDAVPAPLRAAVGLADLALARLDATSRSILAGIVGGVSQDEIARAAGLSKQAVSERVIRHGLAVLAESLTSLWEAP